MKIGDVIDGLGVDMAVLDGDLIADAVVLAKIVEGDGGVRLCVAWSDGMSWLERVGMLAAAVAEEHNSGKGGEAP